MGSFLKVVTLIETNRILTALQWYPVKVLGLMLLLIIVLINTVWKYYPIVTILTTSVDNEN